MDENPITSDYQPRAQSQSPAVPIAIVIGFGMIAAAIYFSGGSNPITAPVNQAEQNQDQPVTGTMTPVNEDDHIRGNPNASIVLVEYSDYDCPFCKNFHDTMNRVMAEYGVTGQVAWVYRHFPIQDLHPNAPYIAHAAECAGELGGNDGFWTFSDLVFNERGEREPTNMLRLTEFAVEAGIDEAAFTECNESGRFQDAIEQDIRDAVASGGRGTPHTVVIVGDQQAVIKGAQPYSEVKRILDNLISQIQGASPEDLIEATAEETADTEATE